MIRRRRALAILGSGGLVTALVWLLRPLYPSATALPAVTGGAMTMWFVARLTRPERSRGIARTGAEIVAVLSRVERWLLQRALRRWVVKAIAVESPNSPEWKARYALVNEIAKDLEHVDALAPADQDDTTPGDGTTQVPQ